MNASTEPKATDWEQVFEAEGTGLISLINQSKTRDGLRACVHAVIQNIFPNEADAKTLKDYEDKLDALISDDDHLEDDKHRISELLREIKSTLQGGSTGSAGGDSGGARCHIEEVLAVNDIPEPSMWHLDPPLLFVSSSMRLTGSGDNGRVDHFL